MTVDQKRELKKRGKRIVALRSAAQQAANRQAIPHPTIDGILTARANEKWLQDHRNHIPAQDAARRFVVTAAEELGQAGIFVECLNCHDLLYSYPDDSTQCACGDLTITFSKPRRGRPPIVAASGDNARMVVLTPRG